MNSLALFCLVLASTSPQDVSQATPIAPSAGGSVQQQVPVSPPAAEEPTRKPDYPVVRVGTLTYLQYDAELGNRQGYNAFDVTRAYFNVTGDLSERVKFRLTPDITRLSDGSAGGSLVLRLKYAYAQFDNLTPRSWLRLGLQQTPWLDFEESINRYRVQGKMFAEREGVIPSSADFGAGYLAGFPADRGEIHVGVYNGEGAGQAEANKYKSVQARLTVRPFPHNRIAKGLRASAYYSLGAYGKDLPRRHGIVMASYEHPNIVATVQWLRGTERPATTTPAEATRSGSSAFVEVRQGTTGWAVFTRLDTFRPGRPGLDERTRGAIAGAAYWLLWTKVRVGLVASDEDVRYRQQTPTENRLLAQVHVQF